MKKSIKKPEDEMILYSYYRSSASYRVRIGLNLKGLDYRIEPLHLLKMGGQQHTPEYRTLNPEGLIPLLKHGDFILSQSMAILEYLDERYPQHPFLPSDERVRAHLRALVYSIVCDIHPLNNLRVLTFLKNDLAIEDEKKLDWYHHWIDLGFGALEARLNHSDAGNCCYMDKPTLADICLIPQIYNALRFNVDMQRYPKLLNIYEHCLTLPAFIDASAEKQIDFEK